MSVAERQAARRAAADAESQQIRAIAGPPIASVPQSQYHVNGVPLSEMAAPLRAKHEAEANALRSFSSREAALRAAKILRENAETWDEERLARGWERVNRYVAEHPEEFKKPEPETPLEPITVDNERMPDVPEREQTMWDKVKLGLGLMNRGSRATANAAGVVANSAVSEIAAGTAGLSSLMVSSLRSGDREANINKAVDTMDAWRDALTLFPTSEDGQKLLQTVAEPLAKLDEAAKDISEIEGVGNEWASAAIYTTLMGLPDVLGFKAGSIVKSSKAIEEAAKLAKDLKISPQPNRMPSDIVGAARNMTPPVRAANAGPLQAALREAQTAQKKQLETLRRRARTSPAYLQTENARAFGTEFRERAVEDGWDLDQMPTVRQRLDEIEELSGANLGAAPGRATAEAAQEVRDQLKLSKGQEHGALPGSRARALPGGQSFIPGNRRGARSETEAEADTAKADADDRTQEAITHLKDWMTLRNRVEKDILARRNRRDLPSTQNERELLEHLAKSMDEALEYQFHRDMIVGDKSALDAWKSYDAARQRFAQNFQADKTIAKLIDLEADPEQIKRWLLGANAVNPKAGLAATMTRMKEVLGRDHPAIEGVRQDYLYDVVAPLLGDEINLQKFINNVDNVIKNQSEILKALDIKPEQLTPLRNWAKTALNNPPRKALVVVEDWVKLMSRFTVGHAIARAGARVSLASNIFRKVVGSHPQVQKQILAEFAEAQFGGPVFDARGIAAGRIIQAAFLANFSEINKQIQDEENVERTK